MLQSERDGIVGHVTTLDGTGNPIQIKQEMKLDGENAYEHAAAAAAAAVVTNSLHPGAFSASGQPGQPTTVAAFNTYYGAGAGTNAGNRFIDYTCKYFHTKNWLLINTYITTHFASLCISSENDAHGGAAYQGNADGGPGGIVHSAEGGFELQTSLLTDKGINKNDICIRNTSTCKLYLKF